LKKTISVCIIFLLIILQSTALACTGFTYSEENQVIVGSNEDWNDYDFWIRFFPAENDKYGRLIFENLWPINPDPDWHCPQNGINDQGLFYDCFATAPLLPVNSSQKPYYYDSNDYYRYSLESYALSVCSTVDEVLDVYDDYNLEHMERYQVLWVDITGDSVIIEGDDIIFKQGNYQVVTNFIQTHPELGGYPCWRYDTAVDMLEEMTILSVEYFTSICDATHQSGGYPSVYSNVYDLNEKILYLYYFYNYDTVVELNLEEELLLGEHVYFLADLFDPVNNQPPEKPSTPDGPTSGNVGEECTYTSQTIDTDGDKILYLFDWGDGTDSGWIQPTLGQGQATHTWNEQGDYEVKVKARDIHHDESQWSDPLEISMPKNKAIDFNFTLLNWLFELFPNAFPMIRYIIGL
jgi:choloylglycine hydrolase